MVIVFPTKGKELHCSLPANAIMVLLENSYQLCSCVSVCLYQVTFSGGNVSLCLRQFLAVKINSILFKAYIQRKSGKRILYKKNKKTSPDNTVKLKAVMCLFSVFSCVGVTRSKPGHLGRAEIGTSH